MPTALSEDQVSVRNAAREFAQEEIAPFGRGHDKNHTFPHGIIQEAARWFTHHAAYQCRGDRDNASTLASKAKLFASERAVEVSDEAIQVHGGAGYVSYYPVERYYQNVEIFKIIEEISKIRKNIIAENLL